MLLVSCFETNTKNIEKILTSVRDTQKIILQKIEKLEKGQQSLKKDFAISSKNSKPSTPKKDTPKKAQSDPNKVYNVAVGNSVVFGNKDAKVTITEWMDFQ